MQRRSFIAGILGAAAAPAIVKAESLMKLWVPEKTVWHTGGIVDLGKMKLVGADELDFLDFNHPAWSHIHDPYAKLVSEMQNVHYSSARHAHEMKLDLTHWAEKGAYEREDFVQAAEHTLGRPVIIGPASPGKTRAIWINPTTGKTEFVTTPFSLPRPAWPADGLS